MIIIEGRGRAGNERFRKNQLENLDSIRDRQIRAYELVRQEDKLIKAKHEADNAKLISIVHRRPKFESGEWVWIYDDKIMVTVGGKHVCF